MLQLRRPEVFGYHNYKQYLRDWVSYRKEKEPKFSLRGLESQAGFAVGYLSAILSGDRHLSLRALSKLIPRLELAASEASYFENLVKLDIDTTQEVRLSALEKMRALKPYQNRNPNEAVMIQYMGRWYYVAIRELASLPGFVPDPKWIQRRLMIRIPLQEIRQALEFLTREGFLAIRDDHSVEVVDKSLDCVGEVYKGALTQYHRQMFSLAAQSIDNTPKAERNLEGATLCIDEIQFAAAREILQEAMNRIRNLPDQKNGEGARVYQLELSIFPITKKAGK